MAGWCDRLRRLTLRLVGSGLLLVSSLLLAAPASAQHECHYETRSKNTQGQITTETVLVCPGHETGTPVGEEASDGEPSDAGGGLCADLAELAELTTEGFCFDFSPGSPAAGVTPGLVLRAFERLTLPASRLIIQPPNGKTLVNFETNFLTDNDQPTRHRVRLLGQRVVIEAEPASYTWHYGDDTSVTTESPGARYPDLEVTHSYLKKGGYEPRVDTTYRGRFRVNGGAWAPIPGTLTVAGEPVGLEVIGARPTLVGAGD